ncbi:hypothetical protein MTO96_006247 [Rhipicephalus appendiculatus]
MEKSPFLELVGPRSDGEHATTLAQSRLTYPSIVYLTLRKRSTFSWLETRTTAAFRSTTIPGRFRPTASPRDPFDAFLDAFLRGKVDCGDYFDQLLSWYDHIDDENVLFVTYEKLKSHTSEEVIKDRRLSRRTVR